MRLVGWFFLPHQRVESAVAPQHFRAKLKAKAARTMGAYYLRFRLELRCAIRSNRASHGNLSYTTASLPPREPRAFFVAQVFGAVKADAASTAQPRRDLRL
jgi:hypothetical protein